MQKSLEVLGVTKTLLVRHRCTSVLSDDSELSTLCDEEPLGTGEVGYGLRDEEVRAELLQSSSEDSSPEADLPFSKKFLNVFVNSTSRSSSKSESHRRTTTCNAYRKTRPIFKQFMSFKPLKDVACILGVGFRVLALSHP